MKTRNDFVSNSSSCSFIVKINSQEDKDILEKILEGYDCCLESMLTIPSYGDVIKSIQDSDIGDFVSVNLGDDDLDTINNLEDIKYEIENSDHEFEVYSDKLAHYTFGKEYKED